MVWSTGLAPIDLVRDMQGVKKERGRIAIDGRLRVPGMEDVFAMGDAAVDPEKPLGPLAQVADQQGKVREHTALVFNGLLGTRRIKLACTICCCWCLFASLSRRVCFFYYTSFKLCWLWHDCDSSGLGLLASVTWIMTPSKADIVL